MKNGTKVTLIFSKLILACSILLTTLLTTSSLFCMSEKKWENDWHFDTAEVGDAKNAREKLTTPIDQNGDGFEEVIFRPAVHIDIAGVDGQAFERIMSRRDFSAQVGQLKKQYPSANATLDKFENENIRLRGLFKEVPNAKGTIIFTPGFWPGHLGPMSSFVKILEDENENLDYNLLFIELNGHGKSEGPSLKQNCASCIGAPNCFSLPKLSNILKFGKNLVPQGLKEPVKGVKFFLGLKTYGLHEYKDIIGSIFYTSARTEGKPIILFGWCAGAFLTARTLIKLRELSPQGQDLVEDLNIQGFVFDSGFGSLQDVIPQAYDYIKNNMIPKQKKDQDDQDDQNNQDDQEKSFLSKAFSFIKKGFSKAKRTCMKIAAKGFLGFSKLIFGPSLARNNPEINLYDKLDQIENIPALFIHSQEDSLAPFANAQRIANGITNHEFWETEGDSHARNQLKYKEEYQIRFRNWLNNTVNEDQQANYQPAEPRQEKDSGNSKNNESNQQNTQLYQEVINSIDEILAILEGPDKSLLALMGALAPANQMRDLLEENKDKFPQEFATIAQNAEQYMNPMSFNLKNAVAALRQMREIAQKELNKNTQENISKEDQSNQNNQENQENQNNQQLNILLQLINILDAIIEYLGKIKENTKEELQRIFTQQEFATLITQPEALLSDPNSNIPQALMDQLSGEQFKKEPQTPEEMRNLYTQMRNIITQYIQQQGQDNSNSSGNKDDQNQTDNQNNKKDKQDEQDEQEQTDNNTQDQDNQKLNTLQANACQEIINILDEMIGHLNNPRKNSQKEFLRLSMQLQMLLENPNSHIPQELIDQISKAEESTKEPETHEEARDLLVQTRNIVTQYAQQQNQDDQELPELPELNNLEIGDLRAISMILDRVINESGDLPNTHQQYPLLQQIITVKNWVDQNIDNNNLLPESPSAQELEHLRIIRNILRLTIIKTGNLDNTHPEYLDLQRIRQIEHYLGAFIRIINTKNNSLPDTAGNNQNNQQNNNTQTGNNTNTNTNQQQQNKEMAYLRK